MDIRDVYYLGGAERLMQGTTKVWPIHTQYCYISQNYPTYSASNNRVYFDDMSVPSTAVYRIAFRPLRDTLSTTGIFWGSYQNTAHQMRLTFSSRQPLLSINGTVISGTTFSSANWYTDHYWEFGNFFIKDLATDTIIASGTPVSDIYDVQKRLNFGYCRVYSAEIWNNGVQLVDLVADQFGNGEIGVWDTIDHRFYPPEYPERVIVSGCTSGEPDYGNNYPAGWYLVPVTDSENDPPSGDYVFFHPDQSAILGVNVQQYASDSTVSVTTGLTVTAMTDGEYMVSDAVYSGLTKFNLIGGIGGGFRLKGKTGDWYLRTSGVTSPANVSVKDVVIGAMEPTYLNKENQNVYINFVSQNYCWALGYKGYVFPDGEGGTYTVYGAGGWKCSGANQSYDYDRHLYLYRLVHR